MRTKTTTIEHGATGIDLEAREAPRRWTFAFGLGANMPSGGRSAATTLRRSIRVLTDHLGPLQSASLYRSAPVRSPSSPNGTLRQPDFFNTVVAGKTHLSPDALLAVAKALELSAGRNAEKRRRDAPRPLDIDLLLYGDGANQVALQRPELTLPHQHLRARRFVLEPLAELLPGWPLPPDGRTAADLLPTVSEQRVDRCPWPEGSA